MASVAIKTLTVEEALSSAESEEGIRFVCITNTCYPDLESLKSEVVKAVDIMEQGWQDHQERQRHVGGHNCVQSAATAQKWQEDDRLWNR